MTREEFTAKLTVIGRSLNNMDTYTIVLVDGRRHVVQCWTIEEHDESVSYSVAYSNTGSPPIRQNYTDIVDVLDFSKEG